MVLFGSALVRGFGLVQRCKISEAPMPKATVTRRPLRAIRLQLLTPLSPNRVLGVGNYSPRSGQASSRRRLLHEL